MTILIDLQTTTEHIIQACLNGDKTGQYKLYKLLAPKLMAVCLRYTKSKAEAEDCLQDAFIKIFNNLKNFNGSGPVEAWARRITVNTLISYLNKHKAMKQSYDIEDHKDYINSNEDLSDRLSYNELIKIINLLPDSKRTVFNLFVIEGFSHREIAEMLEITESTSRAQLSKAKDMLIEIHKKVNYINEDKFADRGVKN